MQMFYKTEFLNDFDLFQILKMNFEENICLRDHSLTDKGTVCVGPDQLQWNLLG